MALQASDVHSTTHQLKNTVWFKSIAVFETYLIYQEEIDIEHVHRSDSIFIRY